MEKAEHLQLTESLKMVLFKGGLPEYTRKYIKAEKPKTLRDTLIRAKEAEELGENHDVDEEIKDLQESMTALLNKLDKPAKTTLSAQKNTAKKPSLCRYCEAPAHTMHECRKFKALFSHRPTVPTCDHCHKRGHSRKNTSC